jgi:glycosyltransferase involved in cell wall biosynthesis
MRILFVQRAKGMAGSVHSLMWLAREVAKSHDVAIGVVGRPPSAQLYEDAGFRVVRIGEPYIPSVYPVLGAETQAQRRVRLVRTLGHTLSGGFRFSRTLRDGGFDLVHTNIAPPTDRIEVLGGLLAGIPVVSHIRSFVPLRTFDKIMLRGVKQFIAVSSAAAQPYVRAGANPSTMNIVHNCVPIPAQISDLDRKRGRQQEGMAENACWAVTAGRLIPWKGIDVAISAVARVRAMGIDLRLLVLGDGPEADGLRRQAADLSAEGAVVFLGWRAQAMDLFALGDILLQPSQAADPFPRSVIEGMAVGLPIVGTDMGGIAEAFRPGASGLVAAGKGAEPLVQLLAGLASDEQLRRQMGMAARLEAERRYGIKVHADAVQKVYSRVLGKR